ncbi:hypothetical protein CYY_009748 [Polysphondylium violaceum]|uniref:Cyclin N-terminal domain-containing protein n=1 Tax=Polysphondylium violaceum TaxID=133409 RepID=A0A8J4PJQ6_9MYCE|nr:hypothetical protein CYY_009748 [Polysphondylium violaceum]
MSIYQQIFRKFYSEKSGKHKDSWEYFVLGLRVYQWLSDNDPAYTNNLSLDEILEAIDEIFDIILSILEMMKSPGDLLTPIVYYANAFVNRAGIKHNQLFNLLLTSTIVTLKFWSESAPTNNKMMADIFEFPVNDINLMERRFLCGIDYNLQLNQTQIDNFLSKINITSALKDSCKQFSRSKMSSSNVNIVSSSPSSSSSSSSRSNSIQKISSSSVNSNSPINANSFSTTAAAYTHPTPIANC